MIETSKGSKHTIKQVFKENWDDFHQLNNPLFVKLLLKL